MTPSLPTEAEVTAVVAEIKLALMKLGALIERSRVETATFRADVFSLSSGIIDQATTKLLTHLAILKGPPLRDLKTVKSMPVAPVEMG